MDDVLRSPHAAQVNTMGRGMKEGKTKEERKRCSRLSTGMRGSEYRSGCRGTGARSGSLRSEKILCVGTTGAISDGNGKRKGLGIWDRERKVRRGLARENPKETQIQIPESGRMMAAFVQQPWFWLWHRRCLCQLQRERAAQRKSEYSSPQQSIHHLSPRTLFY